MEMNSAGSKSFSGTPYRRPLPNNHDSSRRSSLLGVLSESFSTSNGRSSRLSQLAQQLTPSIFSNLWSKDLTNNHTKPAQQLDEEFDESAGDEADDEEGNYATASSDEEDTEEMNSVKRPSKSSSVVATSCTMPSNRFREGDHSRTSNGGRSLTLGQPTQQQPQGSAPDFRTNPRSLANYSFGQKISGRSPLKSSSPMDTHHSVDAGIGNSQRNGPSNRATGENEALKRLGEMVSSFPTRSTEQQQSGILPPQRPIIRVMPPDDSLQSASSSFVVEAAECGDIESNRQLPACIATAASSYQLKPIYSFGKLSQTPSTSVISVAGSKRSHSATSATDSVSQATTGAEGSLVFGDRDPPPPAKKTRQNSGSTEIDGQRSSDSRTAFSFSASQQPQSSVRLFSLPGASNSNAVCEDGIIRIQPKPIFSATQSAQKRIDSIRRAVGMSSETRRILEEFDRMRTPVLDAQKIPVREFSPTRWASDSVATPSVASASKPPLKRPYGPPTFGLTMAPSRAALLPRISLMSRDRQAIAKSTSATSESTSTSALASPKRDEAVQTNFENETVMSGAAATATNGGGKMKTKLTQSIRNNHFSACIPSLLTGEDNDLVDGALPLPSAATLNVAASGVPVPGFLGMKPEITAEKMEFTFSAPRVLAPPSIAAGTGSSVIGTKTASSQSMAQTQTEKASWLCVCCSAPNPENRTSCVCCFANRPAKKPETTLNDKPRVSTQVSGPWVCACCASENPDTQKSCNTCFANRPADKPKASSTVESTASTTSSASSGFKFGFSNDVASPKTTAPSGFKDTGFKASSKATEAATPTQSSFAFGFSATKVDATPAPLKVTGGFAAAKTSTPAAAGANISFSEFKAAAKWTCPKCHLNNHKDELTCLQCSAKRPETSGASALKPWSCSGCFVSNKAEAEQCICCSGPRPVAVSDEVEKKSVSTTAAVDSKPWSCSTCFVPNDALKQTCVACGARKPGNLASAQPKPSLAVSGMSSKTGFGVKPVLQPVSSTTTSSQEEPPGKKSVRFTEDLPTKDSVQAPPLFSLQSAAAASGSFAAKPSIVFGAAATSSAPQASSGFSALKSMSASANTASVAPSIDWGKALGTVSSSTTSQEVKSTTATGPAPPVVKVITEPTTAPVSATTFDVGFGIAKTTVGEIGCSKLTPASTTATTAPAAVFTPGFFFGAAAKTTDSTSSAAGVVSGSITTAAASGGPQATSAASGSFLFGASSVTSKPSAKIEAAKAPVISTPSSFTLPSAANSATTAPPIAFGGATTLTSSEKSTTAQPLFGGQTPQSSIVKPLFGASTASLTTPSIGFSFGAPSTSAVAPTVSSTTTCITAPIFGSLAAPVVTNTAASLSSGFTFGALPSSGPAAVSPKAAAAPVFGSLGAAAPAFGAAPVTASSMSSTVSTKPASFSFGAPVAVAPKSATPSASFSNVAPTSTTSAAVPSFSFGGAPVPVSTPAFSFGAPTAGPALAAPTSAISFGAAPSAAPASTGAAPFQFGATAGPSGFSFGGTTAPAVATAPSQQQPQPGGFAFGAPAGSTTQLAPMSSFSSAPNLAFNFSASSATAPDSTSIFQFAAAAPAQNLFNVTSSAGAAAAHRRVLTPRRKITKK